MWQILCSVLEKPREIKQSHCSQINHNVDCETQRNFNTQKWWLWEGPLSCSKYLRVAELITSKKERVVRFLKFREDSVKVELKSLYMYYCAWDDK